MSTQQNGISGNAIVIALAILMALPLFFCGGCLFIGMMHNQVQEERASIRDAIREEKMARAVEELNRKDREAAEAAAANP